MDMKKKSVNIDNPSGPVNSSIYGEKQVHAVKGSEGMKVMKNSISSSAVEMNKVPKPKKSM